MRIIVQSDRLQLDYTGPEKKCMKLLKNIRNDHINSFKIEPEIDDYIKRWMNNHQRAEARERYKIAHEKWCMNLSELKIEIIA